MKNNFKKATITIGLAIASITFSSCDPEENAAPVPSNFTFEYAISVVDDGETELYEGISDSKEGSHYGRQADDLKVIELATNIDNTTSNQFSASIMIDDADVLMPITYDDNPDVVKNITTLKLSLDSEEYVSYNIDDVATQSISNLRYYSFSTHSDNLGKATYRYDFDNVTMIKTAGSPDIITISGHIICTADE